MTNKTVTTAALQAALKLGAANGQDVKTLAFVVGTDDRVIRKLVDELIEQGVPVCAHPSTGYYIAETREEVDAVCKFLHHRAVHSLGKMTKLRGAFVLYHNTIDIEPQPGAAA